MPDRTIEPQDALQLIDRQESQLWEQKSASDRGAAIQKIGVALANTDGGEFIVGIEDVRRGHGLDRWQGFSCIEAANVVHQALARDASPPLPYEVEHLEIAGEESRGIAVLVKIEKSSDVHFTATSQAFVRRGASSNLILGQQIADLQLSKGAKSFEDQLLSEYSVEDLAREPELQHFLDSYSPQMNPTEFARRERLVARDSGCCRVAAAILFADSPSAVSPRRCAIKVARYNTSREAHRDHLAFPPLTIEGPARLAIERSLEETTRIIESVHYLGPDGSPRAIHYPPEALKEIVVNAVIHRDYNMSDDVHIFIFDNRVEVRSPGGLPGHMTLDLLFSERASRNPKILRLLNRYPDPLNQDVGEGLKTARAKMLEAKLKEPRFDVSGNYFTATLPHERLARPEEIVLEYLETHDEITNAIARGLTGIQSENTMKEVFYHLRNLRKLERVPEKHGNKAAWRTPTTSPDQPELDIL
ncbi:ATP-binding protein [Tessaracoccus flavescens]|uniref:Schlafen AlbA-2 domain-containing protein n=1 Tax=Tessaracoccus flavescens TaxID=399497 RepID=A0A1Q2D1D7_9ACTN|nr:ATP-binding protein [Tessaracoccus flavescens]AQP52091.1 hypothetical protein BW733_15940 [Tessaracoccus flavescens]